MIQGSVIGLQARITIILQTPERSAIEIECVIDTGFEGYLTLPIAVINALELPYLGDINANLANNSNISANVYLGTILWRGTRRDIPIIEMGRRPLVGTALLENYHLGIDFYEGGTVLIDDIL